MLRAGKEGQIVIEVMAQRDARWPARNIPEVLGSSAATFRMLIREYLFISLFRACAESLASENASRLAATERAEKNIDDLLENLKGSFNRLRQRGIDEELFDVLAGYESLEAARAPGRSQPTSSRMHTAMRSQRRSEPKIAQQ